jgi:hypothetical protein
MGKQDSFFKCKENYNCDASFSATQNTAVRKYRAFFKSKRIFLFCSVLQKDDFSVSDNLAPVTKEERPAQHHEIILRLMGLQRSREGAVFALLIPAINLRMKHYSVMFETKIPMVKF